ncbi:MAG: hypothetical protein EBU34_13805, partial [Alphaproteobacteria bacterium]|nr:hypothetical protein [Alphaproteobacteria bacterium]
ADRGMDGREPGLVLLEHLGLRARLADLDLHEKEAVLDGAADLLHRHRVGHQRDAGDARVARGQRRAVGRRDQIVERFDAVLRGVEAPGGEIDAHQRVKRECLAQARVAGDPLGVIVDLVAHRLQQLDRIGERAAAQALQRPLGDRVHQRVAAAFGVAREHVRVAPEHALRAESRPSAPRTWVHASGCCSVSFW